MARFSCGRPFKLGTLIVDIGRRNQPGIGLTTQRFTTNLLFYAMITMLSDLLYHVRICVKVCNAPFLLPAPIAGHVCALRVGACGGKSGRLAPTDAPRILTFFSMLP
eukprot:4997146-Pleurochrysis_carterae.AAC.4